MAKLKRFLPIRRIKEQKIISPEDSVDGEKGDLMRTKFDEQLKNLNEEMIQMGVMIEENIQEAIEALVKSDVDKAKKIIGKNNVKIAAIPDGVSVIVKK